MLVLRRPPISGPWTARPKIVWLFCTTPHPNLPWNNTLMVFIRLIPKRVLLWILDGLGWCRAGSNICGVQTQVSRCWCSLFQVFYPAHFYFMNNMLSEWLHCGYKNILCSVCFCNSYFFPELQISFFSSSSKPWGVCWDDVITRKWTQHVPLRHSCMTKNGTQTLYF